MCLEIVFWVIVLSGYSQWITIAHFHLITFFYYCDTFFSIYVAPAFGLAAGDAKWEINRILEWIKEKKFIWD